MTIDRETDARHRARRARSGSAARSSTRLPAPGTPTASAPGWQNRDIVAHLAAQEIAAAQLLNGDPAVEFDAFREANDGELWVNGFNEWAVKTRAEIPDPRAHAPTGARPPTRSSTLAARLSDDEWRTTEGRVGRRRDRRPVPRPVAGRSSGGSTARTSARARASRRTRSTGRSTWPTTWRSGCCRGRSGRRASSFPGAQPSGRSRGRRRGDVALGPRPRGDHRPEDKKPDAFIAGARARLRARRGPSSAGRARSSTTATSWSGATSRSRSRSSSTSARSWSDAQRVTTRRLIALGRAPKRYLYA